MNKEINLTLINLHNRKYIHGTSIIKGVLSALWEHFSIISDFEIRLKTHLYNQPIMHITDIEEDVIKTIIFGKFLYNDRTLYFYLVPTDIPYKNEISDEKVDLLYDEGYLATRMYETTDNWNMNITVEDDIHLCYNIVSKISNQALFASVPGITMITKKQTWLVGYRLSTIDFLKNESGGTISISKSFNMLAPTCMERRIYFNSIHVGTRICVYA